MKQLLVDSYDYLVGKQSVIDACEAFIDDGETINEHYQQGIKTNITKELERAIASARLERTIIVYYQFKSIQGERYRKLDAIPFDSFINTSLIREILVSNDTIRIEVPTGMNCFYLSAANEVPGGGRYGFPRTCELFVERTHEEEYARLSGSIDQANGKEQILLAPGRLIKQDFDLYLYRSY
jgi:hypothetical protein